jgi:hypothetical protein
MNRRPPLLRAVLAVVVTVLASLAAVPAADRAAAADLRGFDPGHIISDATFYASASMGVGEVQSFLNQRGAACVPAAGSTCLKSYTETTASRAATARCAAYAGAPSESAASIITKVAVACGINPQVILVTLQKEQGLVTAAAGRTPAVYQKAMGYGCPDTAACDSLYYGFFNQVYSAASQFKNYAQSPTRYAHRAGMTNNVRFHPNAACGTSAVYIQNQATASLYNYTPYQPNAAALAAGYGTGDACSSYGNRNFWNYFSDWFGNPTGSVPTGFFDAVTATDTTITATGWALDPDTMDPIQIHMYVDGASAAFTANTSRPDIGAAFGKGDNHGFSATMNATPGPHNVCIYAINVPMGPNLNLGCRTVTVAENRLPTGFFDAVTATGGTITATGWTFDPDTSEPIQIHMYVDGASAAFTANTSRPDIGTAFGRGPNHGFTASMTAAAGPHNVCIYAINTPMGPNLNLGCRTVTVVSTANQPPTGFFDAVSAAGGTITATGWTFDPDTTSSIQIRMAVDGASETFTANASRPDIGTAFGRGPNHGFTASMTAGVGTHTVCITAMNVPAGPDFPLGCRTVTVLSTVNQLPTGFFDAVTATDTTITATGWALDPDTTDPIQIHMYVDGASAAFTANTSRPDIGAAFGKGDNHGFGATMNATPGPHNVCIYAINTPAGPNLNLGCRTVTVKANQLPTGFFDAVASSGGTITATGWTFDPDTSEPIQIHMYVDGASAAFTANTSRPDIGTAFGRGPNHGFTASMTAAAGPHNVCIYAINTPMGPNLNLGCRTVTVTANQLPTGFFDAVASSGGTITATGWTFDPDTSEPIQIHMYVDGASAAFTANTSRPDIGTAFGRGPNHGFTASMTAAAGPHNVCIYAINTPMGPNLNLGCRTVTVA